MAVVLVVLLSVLLLAAAFVSFLDYLARLERREADPVGPVRLTPVERRSWAGLERSLRRSRERDPRTRSRPADHHEAGPERR